VGNGDKGMIIGTRAGSLLVGATPAMSHEAIGLPGPTMVFACATAQGNDRFSQQILFGFREPNGRREG